MLWWHGVVERLRGKSKNGRLCVQSLRRLINAHLSLRSFVLALVVARPHPLLPLVALVCALMGLCEFPSLSCIRYIVSTYIIKYETHLYSIIINPDNHYWLVFDI